MWAASLTCRRPAGSMPVFFRPSISSSKPMGSMTTPLPMTQVVRLRRMPEGMRCRMYLVRPTMTVWPALAPPWARTTMSACSVRKSMILPLPSSPHWAPTRMVFNICLLAVETNPPKPSPGSSLISAGTLGKPLAGVNACQGCHPFGACSLAKVGTAVPAVRRGANSTPYLSRLGQARGIISCAARGRRQPHGKTRIRYPHCGSRAPRWP